MCGISIGHSVEEEARKLREEDERKRRAEDEARRRPLAGDGHRDGPGRP